MLLSACGAGLFIWPRRLDITWQLSSGQVLPLHASSPLGREVTPTQNTN